MDLDQEPPNTGSSTNERSSQGGAKSLDLQKPCRVVDVSFKGVRRTRSTILAKIVADVFPAKSLLECIEKSVQVRENLKNLNAFSSVEIEMFPINGDDDENYKVTFVVQERGRISASAQTAVDKYSSHLNIEFGLPNLTGKCDSIKFNSKFNKRMYSGECRYVLPITPWRNLWSPVYSLSYGQYDWDQQPSGFDQQNRAITNQYDFFSSPNIEHSIIFENVWRYIKSSSCITPIEIREQCGHSVKSSLKHIVTWDNRIKTNYPSEGILAKLSSEVATNLVTSMGAKFTRHELNLQYNTSLIPKYDLLFQANLSAGALLRPHRVNICDKFFLGGPLTLRGFKLQGVGPIVRDHPIGASSYMAAGFHLYPILPFTKPESPINEYIRPHIFLNAGTQGELSDIWKLATRRDLNLEAIRFKDSMRYSCGFGLVTYFLNLRFEINYCIPIIFKSLDKTQSGIQWGFGLNYT